MTVDDFVKGFYLHRQSLVDTYFDTTKKTEISELIRTLDLDSKETERLRQILDYSLRDTLYTILLGLDGAANIGGTQTNYQLFDDQNNELTGGEIEAAAYDYFHNNKLQIDKGEADFIAILTYMMPEQGGRQTPAYSGYRPQVKFEFADIQTSGLQTFIDRKNVYPGDTVEAEIRLASGEHLTGRLKEQMSFDFREGARIIGTGKIKHILNARLREASR